MLLGFLTPFLFIAIAFLLRVFDVPSMLDIPQILSQTSLSIIVIVVCYAILPIDLYLHRRIYPKNFSKVDKIDSDEAFEDTQRVSTQTLPLIAGTLAAISFLLGQFDAHPALEGPLYIIASGLALMVLSFRMERIAGLSRAYGQLQDVSQFYGLMLVFIGLAFAYGVYIPSLSSCLIIIPVLLVVIKCVEEVLFIRFLVRENEPETRTTSQKKGGILSDWFREKMKRLGL